MSGSEPRLMFGRGGETYGMSLHNPSPSSSPSSGGGAASMSGMCLAFSTDASGVYKPIMPNSPSYHQLTMVPCGSAEGGPGAAQPPVQSLEVQTGVDHVNGLDNNLVEPMKRKRGRPRKYALEGCSGAPISSAGSGFSGAPTASPPPGKKGRGRPPGSGKKQQNSAGSEGVGFTPHVITVKAGEDITTQILSFTQNGARAVCILSANGAISNVTLRQSATSGGSVTYEGRFEILSLSGSFTLSERGGQRSRTGGLSVSIAGPDGRVLGGCVAGLLIAASPVQVVIGSFVVEESKSEIQSECFSVPALKVVGGGGAGGSPPSQVNNTVNELSGDPRSPINHQHQHQHQGFAGCNNRNNMAWQLCPPGNNL